MTGGVDIVFSSLGVKNNRNCIVPEPLRDPGVQGTNSSPMTVVSTLNTYLVQKKLYKMVIILV